MEGFQTPVKHIRIQQPLKDRIIKEEPQGHQILVGYQIAPSSSAILVGLLLIRLLAIHFLGSENGLYLLDITADQHVVLKFVLVTRTIFTVLMLRWLLDDRLFRHMTLFQLPHFLNL